MKARVFSILVILALTTISMAARRPNVKANVMVPATVQAGVPFDITLYVTNEGSRSVTIREIELYAGPEGDHQWGEIWSQERVTIAAGQMATFTYAYKCDTPGLWSIQCRMRFGGGDRGSLITPVKFFTVE